MANFVKLPVTLLRDPRMFRAGLAGGMVYIHLLAHAKAMGYRGGRIPAADLEPEFLAHAMSARTDEEQVLVRSGIAAAQSAGLILADGDGYLLADWELHQVDQTAAERQRRSRAKKIRPAAPAPRIPPASPDSEPETVTDRNVTGVTSDRRDITHRVEESRGDSPPGSPPDGGDADERSAAPDSGPPIPERPASWKEPWRALGITAQRFAIELAEGVLRPSRPSGPLVDPARSIQRSAAEHAARTRKFTAAMAARFCVQVRVVSPDLCRRVERKIKRESERLEPVSV